LKYPFADKFLVIILWLFSLICLGLFEIIVFHRLPLNLQLLEIGQESVYSSINSSQLFSVRIILVLIFLGITLFLVSLPSKLEFLLSKLLNSKGFLTIFSIIALLVQTYFYWGQVTDDRYINARIGKNISESFLPIVNVGDTATPATSFIMPYVYAIFINYSDYLAPAFISLLLYFTLIVYTIWHSDLTFSRAMLTISLSMYPSVIYWSMAGMETAIVISFIGFIALALKKDSSYWLTYFFIGVLIWIRPELLIMTVVVFIQVAVREINSKYIGLTKSTLNKKVLLQPLLMTVGPVLYFAVFLVNFFPILPTPFYFKGSFGNSMFRDSPTLFKEGLFDFLAMMSGSFLLIYIALFWSANKISSLKNLRKVSLSKTKFGSISLWPTIIVLSVYYASLGYNHMSFFYRYWAPVYILVIIQLFYTRQGGVINQAFTPKNRFYRVRYQIIFLQIITSLIVVIYSSQLSLGIGISNRRDWFSANDYTSFMKNNYEKIQNNLQKLTKPGDTVFTFGAIQAMNLSKDVFVYDIYYNPVSITTINNLLLCRQNFKESSEIKLNEVSTWSRLVTNYPKGVQYPGEECLLQFDFLVMESQIPDSVRPKFTKVAPDVYKNNNY
jgi:hypothetical protein